MRTVFHHNRKIESVCRYAYDPLYRLTRANGRESAAQAELDLAPPDGDYRDYPFVGARLGDPHALQEFAETYDYDPVGNFVGFVHRAERGGWSRRFAYREESLLEPGKHSNRLSWTQLQDDNRRGPERYLYDANGDMTQMPHLPSMQWDFMDRLIASARQVVNEGASETTFYQYDGGGQRVRKVTERRNGKRKTERRYLGGFEVFREYDSDGDAIALERETLHVMDDKTRIALVETLTCDHGHGVHAPEPVQRYQLANHLGSATLELDEAARLISYEEYAPYGITTYQAGRHAAEVRRKRYRYTGMERDEETGFTYHGARYYAPWIGGWTSCDPLGLKGGLNLYAYCARSPILHLDATGNEPLVVPVNEKAQKIMWRGKPLGPTVTIPRAGRKSEKGDAEGKKGSPASTGGMTGGAQGGVQRGTGSQVGAAPTPKQEGESQEGGDGSGPRQGADAGAGPLAASGEAGVTGGEGTHKSPLGGQRADRPDASAGGAAGKEGGSKDGEKDGRGGKSSILDDLAALASLIMDPESLYNAKHSGNTGKGVQVGSTSGIISGWFAQVLLIGIVIWDYASGAIKKGFQKLREGAGWIKTKLLPGPSLPRLPAPPTELPLPEEPVLLRDQGHPYRDPPPGAPPVEPHPPPAAPEPDPEPKDPWSRVEPEIDKNRRR